MEIKKFIWDLLPYFYDKHDLNPDMDGKGVLRRLMELLGEEWDDNVLNYLNEDSDDYFLKNLNPLLADQRFINIIADILGNPPIILDDLEYAKLLKYIIAIYKVKGSKLAYQIFFRLLGFTIIINELEPDEDSYDNLYDIGLLYDTNAQYDLDYFLGSNHCVEYELSLNPIDPGMELPADLEDKVARIISFIEPINAQLRPTIFSKLLEPSDLGGYGIAQQLFISLENEEEFEYTSIHYDVYGNPTPGDDIKRFDDDTITFDDKQIRWSTIKKNS